MTTAAAKVITVIALALATTAVVAMAWLKLQPQAGAPATATPAPTASAASTAPTASPTPTAIGTDLASIAGLLQAKDGATVLVLGDASGDGADEWASIWASNYLAKSSQVKYAAWDAAAKKATTGKTFGTGDRQLTLINASLPQPDMKGEAARARAIDAAADVVVLNYGNGVSPSAISAYLQAIHQAAAAANPDAVFVAVIQNPGLPQTEVQQLKVTKAVRKWASSEKIATVDVYQAFTSDPAARALLVNVDGTPTSRGSRLWAKTMAKALTPA